MEYNEKKVWSYIELSLIVISIFSFSYFLDATSSYFENGEEEFETEIYETSESNLFLMGKNLVSFAQKKLNKPIFGIVSAEEFVGCCEESIDGIACATTISSFCAPDALFAENLICTSASFCQKGCCYDENAGIYDKNVLESQCSASWDADPNCNFPAADFGCCVLGSSTQFETYGQCVIDTEEFALGDGVVDWQGDLSETQCLQIPFANEKGACVLEGGSCTVNTLEACSSIGGDFASGYLCTSPSLDTICVPTTETMCIEGLYGVYFQDSCGNEGNIYDSSKVNDQFYWNEMVPIESSCNPNSENGNANDPSCGNCNLFIGGICSNAIIDDFDVDYGTNYCRDVSCEFEGEQYENGESFCQYDGKIGEGDDVVGSRHWKYVCNQGDMQLEPCEDYRNEICVQQNTEVDGEVIYRNANCIPNNWRACVTINSEAESEEELIDDCNSAVNCEITDIAIADHFAYPVCTPKYPGGFDTRDERYQETTTLLCGKATQKCTVYQEEKFFGGCKYAANEACLGSGFAEQMNDFCTALGDCGGAANYIGDFEKNYNVNGAPDLSSAWIAKLTKYAEPIAGQYAHVEDYSEYLQAAGVAPFGGVNEHDLIDDISTISQGVGGIGAAVGMAFASTTSVTIGPGVAAAYNAVLGTSLEAGTFTTASSTAAFSGAAIGAAIGAYAGLFLAEELGLSPFGTLLMAVGGALVGGAIGYTIMVTGLLGIGPIGWAIIIIGVVLMIIGAFFGGSDCDPIDVSFECNPWQPESGGDKCEECNSDPGKPCSKYRCETLGAGCQFLNYDADSEDYYICANSCQNDPSPP
ncbi:hypothetical protein HOI04_03235, partial [archaeon]|nr:hypothetical protein [archaeon]